MATTVVRTALAAMLLLAASAAQAQQRPLVTQDPETIGAGRILLETGFDYGRDVLFPTSGLKGNLLRMPLVGIMFGVGDIVEVQVTGGPYNRLSITDRLGGPLAGSVATTGNTTTDVEDIVMATKIRLLAENATRPGIGLRFATKLPNASTDSGIGTDTMDFMFSALVGKTIESIRVVGNVGFAIMSDPTRGDRQNDVLIFGGSVARAMTPATEIVGEINGRANTRPVALPGTESRATMRVGGRYTRGAARFDAGALIGMTERDPGLGFTVGFTYIFNAFQAK